MAQSVSSTTPVISSFISMPSESNRGGMVKVEAAARGGGGRRELTPTQAVSRRSARPPAGRAGGELGWDGASARRSPPPSARA